MLNNQSIKTRQTQNLKAKHISNAHTKTKKEREKWQNHLEPFSFHTLEEPFLWLNPWTGSEGEKLFKFERNMRALKDLQGERERIEVDSGFQMLSCRCFVEWLATYSNLVKYDWQRHNDDRDAAPSVDRKSVV